MAIDELADRSHTQPQERRVMGDAEVENAVRSILGQRGGPVSAREVVDAIRSQAQVPPTSVKMAILRLANRSELSVSPDRRLELVGQN